MFDECCTETPHAGGLFPDFKPLDDFQITLRIDGFQVIQKATTTADHHQEAAPAGVVFRMGLEMPRQLANARGQ